MGVIRTLVVALAVSAASGCSPPPPLKEYAYPSWGFAVSFRRPPKELDSPASSDGTKAHTFLVESSVAGRDDLVNVIDGAGSTKSEDQALSDAPAALASYVGGTLGPMTYTATGKVMGREFTIKRPGRPVARARVFVANKHLYQIIAQSPRGPDDPETSSFLDSFRLTGS
jgi:hypothetical protein